MDRKTVIAKLRAHAPELKEVGVAHLRVFGSTARDEASVLSDVDLLVEFDSSRRQTLVSVGSLQSRLADILSVKVDLSSADWMREPVRSRALQEAVLAF
jgi:hypothetical protein